MNFALVCHSRQQRGASNGAFLPLSLLIKPGGQQFSDDLSPKDCMCIELCLARALAILLTGKPNLMC